MSALAVVPCNLDSLQARALASCLQGLSETSRRVYSARIWRFSEWLAGAAMSRESVRSYLRSQELAGATPQVRNQTLAALKRFASEAAELGMLDAAEAARIRTIKSKRMDGTKAGRWLTEQQLAQLLQLPDRTTMQGRRDACLLALLTGCGLRRAEACGLDASQVRTIAGRMYLWNVRGKGGRVRTIQVPKAVESDIERWKQETAQQ